MRHKDREDSQEADVAMGSDSSEHSTVHAERKIRENTKGNQFALKLVTHYEQNGQFNKST